VNKKEQVKRKNPETKKNRSAYVYNYSGSGKLTMKNIPIAFVAIPLTPLPNIIAPIYSPGSGPANPKIDA